MQSINPYAAGTKVYNGGSNTATRGTLDPMGYINRSLNQPSQSRSGLASAAISRLEQQAPRMERSYSTPSGFFGGSTPSFLTVSNPDIQSTMAGNMRLARDPDLTQQMNNAYATYNQAMLRQNQKADSLNSEYAQQRRDLDRQASGAINKVSNNFAGRGMLKSSGMGQATTDTATTFMNALGDLDRRRAEGFADLNLGQGDLFTALQNAIRTVTGTQLQRSADNARSYR